MCDFETITYALFGVGDLDSAIAAAHQRNRRRQQLGGSYGQRRVQNQGVTNNSLGEAWGRSSASSSQGRQDDKQDEV